MAARFSLAPRLHCLRMSPPAAARNFSITALRAKNDEKWPQRTPLGAYYESILNHQPPYPFEEKPEEPPNSADPEVLPPNKTPVESTEQPPRPKKKKPGRKPKSDSSASASISTSSTSGTSPPMPSPPPSSAEAKARIIFGSASPGPAEQAERLASKQSQSIYIAGVLVPPRPEEPDNCCMSGCVNCVWDQYRDEVEEWTAKKNEAQARMDKGSGSAEADGARTGVRVGEARIAKDFWDEEAMQSLPVGIREFMKTEKRLKQMHEDQGTAGG